MHSTGKQSGPARLLIIDHHDSYTLNLLISLVEATGCPSSQLLSRTVVLPHTHALLCSVDRFKRHLLPHFDALILGPGPGHPAREKDFGPAERILKSILDGDFSLPTLGICLGHQGIAVACGGKVVQADSLRHGLHSRMCILEPKQAHLAHSGLFDSFQGSNCAEAVDMIRYNSLTVDEATLPTDLMVTAWSHDPSCLAPPPLRTAFSPEHDEDATSPSLAPSQRVVMAMQHRRLPLWGVQFHPESISSQGGEKIIGQFISNCRDFWLKHVSAAPSSAARLQARERVHAWDQSTALPEWVQELGSPLVARSLPTPALRVQGKRFQVVTQPLMGTIPSYLHSSSVFESLFKGRDGGTSSVWLDSSRAGDPQSRFSYMSTPSWSICYEAAERKASICVCDTLKPLDMPLASSSARVDLVHGLATPKTSRSNSSEAEDGGQQDDFWTFLSAIQKSLQDCSTCEGETTFKTGFVGYFDYEMRGESLTRGKTASQSTGRRSTGSSVEAGAKLPSVWFGFCDRLLAHDHQTGEWKAVYLLCNDGQPMPNGCTAQVEDALASKGVQIGLSASEASRWIAEVEGALAEVAAGHCSKERTESGPSLPLLTPSNSAQTYKAKVEAARGYICKGESYELCLTNQFTGSLPEASQENAGYCFDLYKGLRIKNPAPYSAFLSLGRGRYILSTSPERFMSIQADGRVEMRPIKGTLARAGYRKGEEEYRQGKERGDKGMREWCETEDKRRRRALECDPKERAENLMIVDLIRADLLSFCSPDSVQVPSLMQVESYESVHQLVTTILGQKSEAVSSLDALKRSFPPGSMTGAPKVRSIDVLDKLEDRPRGVYSGMLGWLGLDGAASFSVVIRTVVIDGCNVTVGAGGAITYLSDAEQEWQEVVDKVSSIGNLRGG